MADIAIFRINYKSDFILTLDSDAGWMTPFCVKFWTGAPSKAYYAYYDGMSYTHCTPVEGEPTKLLVQFDDHHLPIGDLKFQIGYHFTVADFPTSVEDEVINQASVIIEVDDAPAQVMLDFNGETAPEIQFSLPAYANEAQRIANEQARIAAEEQRISNEEARIAAEQERQQNEQQRISNEEARVREFARLKTESESATDAANDAAALANEKAQLADDKAALAQAAAALANAKAQLAADKAALAQAAATLANEKAQLAEDKANLAQQKADYAQTQGNYAKAQGDAAKTEAEAAHSLNEEVSHDEATRQQQEAARQQAEAQRVIDFNAQMQQQQTAYTNAEAARDTAFDEAETERDAKVDAKVADITNLQAQIGYFVCDTNAATAAKTIVATGYALTTGGNIRIKMTNANTADAVTLNINSTGAKALFYNGTQASSTNSWEEGEVIEVYYDGTQFMASNSQGSKTINSENVVMNNENFASDNVDGALTELLKGGVEIDLTDGVTLQKSISGTTWETRGYSSFIDMTEYAGQEISITANATYDVNYAFTSSTSIGVNYSAVDNIVSGRAIERIPVGTTVTDIVPAGTSYLCLRRSSTTSAEDTDMLPESVMIGETAIDVSGGTILKARMTFPSWTTGGQRSCSIIPLPYGGRTIEITANDTHQCTYAFFKDGTSGSNHAAVTNFAKNSMTSYVGAGITVVKEIPTNVTHLYLFRDNSSSTDAVAYMPKKVFVRNTLIIAADSVRYSDYYNKDSNVQTVLESVNMDICGVEVLDKSTFYDIGNNDIISPALLLYKGDTVNIIGNTNYSQHIPIVRWYDDYTTTLVPRTSGATSYTYTATEDMYIRIASHKDSTFTINRANKRIDNIEMACHDIPSKLYLSEMLGDARKPEYEIIHNKYINNALSIVDGYEGFYTNPVALKTGETIHLYCDYNGWTIAHLVKSDSEGNLISIVAKTVTDTHYTYRATEDCYIVTSGFRSASIIIVSNSKIQDYMDDYDARNRGTGILDFYANKQTENMLRQLTWGYNSNNGGTGVVKPLCLLHFSDIHNNEVGESGSGADGVNNINRIVTFYNKYKDFIHDIIHTGDCVVSNYGQSFPWTTGEDVAKILNVIGNHDLQGAGNMVDVYNRYFAPYVEGWGVTLPENAAEEGRCYYYKDYTANKVRLITLMNWEWLGSSSATQTYLTSQKTWFQEVLEDARTQGLTVVCAVHTHPANVTMLEGCSFNSWEYRYHGDVNGSQASTPVADSTNVGGYADDVQNFIDAGGDFACWICGHTHFDAVGPLSGFPDQFCIIIENAACRSYWCADHRITGTLSQDCFNIMSIDAYCKRINVMRIGSNFASAIQHKGAFSYDYKNKKLLNCW